MSSSLRNHTPSGNNLTPVTFAAAASAALIPSGGAAANFAITAAANAAMLSACSGLSANLSQPSSRAPATRKRTTKGFRPARQHCSKRRHVPRQPAPRLEASAAPWLPYVLPAEAAPAAVAPGVPVEAAVDAPMPSVFLLTAYCLALSKTNVATMVKPIEIGIASDMETNALQHEETSCECATAASVVSQRPATQAALCIGQG